MKTYKRRLIGLVGILFACLSLLLLKESSWGDSVAKHEYVPDSPSYQDVAKHEYVPDSPSYRDVAKHEYVPDSFDFQVAKHEYVPESIGNQT